MEPIDGPELEFDDVLLIESKWSAVLICDVSFEYKYYVAGYVQTSDYHHCLWWQYLLGEIKAVGVASCMDILHV